MTEEPDLVTLFFSQKKISGVTIIGSYYSSRAVVVHTILWRFSRVVCGYFPEKNQSGSHHHFLFFRILQQFVDKYKARGWQSYFTFRGADFLLQSLAFSILLNGLVHSQVSIYRVLQKSWVFWWAEKRTFIFEQPVDKNKIDQKTLGLKKFINIKLEAVLLRYLKSNRSTKKYQGIFMIEEFHLKIK